MARRRKFDPEEMDPEELEELEEEDSRGILRDGQSVRVPLYMRDGSINPSLTPTQRAKAQHDQQTADAQARKFGLQDALQLHRPGFRYNTDAAARTRIAQAYEAYDAATQTPGKPPARPPPPTMCPTGALQPTPRLKPMPSTTARWPMPGAHADDSLLRSTSWAAEKLFKQRGNFASVLFVAEYADGTRQRLERYCNNAPNSVSDAELLTELAQDVALDFAATNVVRFGVAYLCKRVITLRPIDPNATMKPTTTKRQGDVVELHSASEPVGLFRNSPLVRWQGHARRGGTSRRAIY